MLRCPFCNRIPELTNEDNYGYRDDEWYIKCDCGLLFGFARGYNEKEVIVKWNIRFNGYSK